eukprot:357499-Chlamydomonas_euryale.AAC.14
MAAATATKEALYLTQLFDELALMLKHIDVHYHLIKDHIAKKDVKIIDLTLAEWECQKWVPGVAAKCERKPPRRTDSASLTAAVAHGRGGASRARSRGRRGAELPGREREPGRDGGRGARGAGAAALRPLDAHPGKCGTFGGGESVHGRDGAASRSISAPFRSVPCAVPDAWNVDRVVAPPEIGGVRIRNDSSEV